MNSFGIPSTSRVPMGAPHSFGAVEFLRRARDATARRFSRALREWWYRRYVLHLRIETPWARPEPFPYDLMLDRDAGRFDASKSWGPIIYASVPIRTYYFPDDTHAVNVIPAGTPFQLQNQNYLLGSKVTGRRYMRRVNYPGAQGVQSALTTDLFAAGVIASDLSRDRR